MVRSGRWRILPVAVACGLLALVACATDEDAGDSTATTGGSDSASSSHTGELTVFAAASLNEVFDDIANGPFAEEYPDVEVTFSFAGSADLVAQVDSGAPADVLATANEQTMDEAVASGIIDDEPEIFVENVLTLVVPRGNPADVTGIDDSLEAANVVICAPQVPCGQATAELTERLGVEIEPVSEESSVTDVLNKVTSGQADAGMVYDTDAASAGDEVETIDIPGAEDVVNHYPIAAVTGGDGALAAGWLEVLASAEVEDMLTGAGFVLP